nr:PREDICTED: uncharacterized protein LOC105662417 [Megachile rotundata]
MFVFAKHQNLCVGAEVSFKLLCAGTRSFRKCFAGKMALWNKVFTGFDKEEETINFGKRTVTENNGFLYETSTVATIQCSGEVSKEPSILASVQYSRVCIIIDESITIFKDETCTEILLNISFESAITCYCISNNGLFLFIVLSNGALYCLDLNKGQIIFTK